MSRSYEKRVMFHVLRCPQQSWSWPSEKTDSHHAFLKLCAFYGFFTNSKSNTLVVKKDFKNGAISRLEKGSNGWFECSSLRMSNSHKHKSWNFLLAQKKKSLSFLSQEPTFCQPDRVTVPLRGCTCTMCNRYLWNPLFIEFTSGNCTSCTASFKPLKSPYRASTRCS